MTSRPIRRFFWSPLAEVPIAGPANVSDILWKALGKPWDKAPGWFIRENPIKMDDLVVLP